MSDVIVNDAGAPTPTPEPQGTPSPIAPQVATPPAPAPAPTPQVPDGYVPSYRVRETREQATREATQRFQAEQQALQAKYVEMERKFNALAGITPPPDPNISNVKNQFGQLYPGLSKIEERAQDILGILERSGDLEAQTQHYWQSYGRQTMDNLFKHAEASLGGPLTDDGKKQLHASFVGFIQSSPELTQRYSSDPTVVEDFWKQFTSSFIDPVRRIAAAGVAQRAPGQLPQDTPSGAPRSSPTPTLDGQGLDARAAAAWNSFQSKTGRT